VTTDDGFFSFIAASREYPGKKKPPRFEEASQRIRSFVPSTLPGLAGPA
jgi:hypothetical protein